MASDTKTGAIALVGSGEYTAAMEETDLYLLETVGGLETARVVIMATAAGLEDPSSPARWTQMGLGHFTKLGAKVEAAEILGRKDSEDPRWLPLLQQANFFYFSGGNPQHLIESMRDTPAWDVIRSKWSAGAVLAGCSAGAMAIGGHTANIRSIRMGSGPTWSPALGVLPKFITMPHFDRMAGFIGEAMFQQMINSAPAGSILLGVDEDTALVRTINGNGTPEYRVMGRQTVSVFDGEGRPTVYRSEQSVPLQQ